MDRSIARRAALLGALVAAILAASLAPGLSAPASAGGSGTSTGSVSPGWRSVPLFYQYTHVTWRLGWTASPMLVRQNWQWRSNHPNATRAEIRDWHTVLRHRWRAGHFHTGVRWASGQATWYDGDGKTGACGVRLRGLYAASRTLPCGALVTVRHAGAYVFVHVLDRGPFGSRSRILDLSPTAFRKLAPLGTGVIDIRMVQVNPWTRYRLSR
jgi:Lytic transglycolase